MCIKCTSFWIEWDFVCSIFDPSALTHPLRNLQLTFRWAPLCYMHVYMIRSFFFFLSFVRIFPCSFQSTHFRLSFILHVRVALRVCVRLRESVSSYASVCVLKHHINLSDKTIQLKGLLNLRAKERKKCIWLDCTLHVFCYRFVRWPLSNGNRQFGIWKRFFCITSSLLFFPFVVSIIIKAAGILQEKKHVDELD